MTEYIVACDSEPLSEHSPARLYQHTGHRNRAVLKATGSLGQIQHLADELNTLKGGAADDRNT
jgi:hypothetical protein